MSEIIFIESHRGDRTNIMSSFELWTKETFLSKIKDKKESRSLYRYGYVDRGWVKLTKDMSLEEFETVFNAAEIEAFTPQQITGFFRKEVSEKYGEHKIKSAIKTLTKKELVRGTVYEDVEKRKYLYLGKVKLQIEKNPGYGKNELVSEKEGEGFDWNNRDLFTDQDIQSVDILKGIKKLVKAVGTVELKDIYTYTRPKGYYNYHNVIYTLTLL